MERERLAYLFRRWSDIEAVANLSPLYAVLGHTVAGNPGLLDLAAEAQAGQPPPNILFAAVHAELAKRPEEPLATYYRTLGGTREAEPAVGPLFREFCLRNREALLRVVRTRLVQTNEVRRSALLLPAFSQIAAASGRPLALIEVGPSAGLNLLFDRYQYRYGELRLGDSESPVVLECDPRGKTPDIAMPTVVARAGIDLNPLDVTNEADVAWLRALLWPEHVDRLALLEAAVEVAQREPPVLYRGDLIARTRALVEGAPEDAAVCLFATFVLHQLPADLLDTFRELLVALSYTRDVHLVVIGYGAFIEPGSQLDGEEQVWALRLRGGAGEYRVVAVANPHGRWIDWTRATEWRKWDISGQIAGAKAR